MCIVEISNRYSGYSDNNININNNMQRDNNIIMVTVVFTSAAVNERDVSEEEKSILFLMRVAVQAVYCYRLLIVRRIRLYTRRNRPIRLITLV